MDRNTAIGLGDLVRAIRKLNARDVETQKTIAEMLGMTLLSKAVDLPSERTAADLQAADRPTEPPPDSDPELEEKIDDSVPITLDHAQSESDEWIKGVEPLPLPSGDDKYVAPDLEPLLLPQWTRAILSAALVTNAEDGLPDIERITETIARGEAIRELPTRSSPTLCRGVQLLIDKSLAMMPFIRDQAWLQKEIQQVVGKNHVELRRFVGSPLRRGAGSESKPWKDYAPPMPGTPVVVLTDLGICQPILGDDWADVQEWQRFGVAVQHAHCPLIAFVPYGESRWPTELRRYMTIIQWDRKTTAPIIRSIVGDGLEVAKA
jgi:hypothetical protein